MGIRSFAVVLMLPFSVLSLYALVRVGYAGIWGYAMGDPAGWQVLADLVVALVLVMTWLIRDARDRGRNPWPWVLATLALGSFGPLVYLATRGEAGHARRPEQTSGA